MAKKKSKPSVPAKLPAATYRVVVRNQCGKLNLVLAELATQAAAQETAKIWNALAAEAGLLGIAIAEPRPDRIFQLVFLAGDGRECVAELAVPEQRAILSATSYNQNSRDGSRIEAREITHLLPILARSFDA